MAVLSTIPRVSALPVPLAVMATVEPFRATAPVVLPAVRVEPAVEAKVVLPVDDRVVKAAVDGVVVPIAVLLIPVAVVVKLPEIISKLLTPVEMLEALRPDKERVPDVAVRLSAPVVWVKPLEAVRVPAEVIAPVPVVLMLPEVESTPFSLMVSAVTPPDLMTSELLVAALVSSMTRAGLVPALVRVNEVATPELLDSS